MKTFDKVLKEKTESLRSAILEDQKILKGARGTLIKFGSAELKSCVFASERKKAGYADPVSKTPVWAAKCSQHIAQGKDKYDVNSYHCAVCSIEAGVFFNIHYQHHM